MASKFTVTAGNTNVDFNWTAPTASIQSIVGGCAEALFDRGQGDHGTEASPKLFTSLTNAQKLTIVEDYLKSVILDMANSKKSDKAQVAARTTEEASKYTL